MTTAPCPCPRCAALAGPVADLPPWGRTLLDACTAVIAAAASRHAAWAARRRLAHESTALAQLDDATLRDIGLARCEVESIAAEAQGLVDRTRLRVLQIGP